MNYLFVTYISHSRSIDRFVLNNNRFYTLGRNEKLTFKQSYLFVYNVAVKASLSNMLVTQLNK